MMADTAPVMVWRTGPDKLCDFVNKPWLEFRGRTFEEERGDGWFEGVHPADREVRQQYQLTTHLPGASRFGWSAGYNGQTRNIQAWLLATGVPRRLPDGSFNGYIGSSIDITDRRTTEKALQASERKLRASHEEIQHLASRLITAQEVERSPHCARAARRHWPTAGAADDRDRAPGPRQAEGESRDARPHEAVTRVRSIAKSVQDLSHRLHPARLRLLGLIPALDALRNELSRRG